MIKFCLISGLSGLVVFQVGGVAGMIVGFCCYVVLTMAFKKKAE